MEEFDRDFQYIVWKQNLTVLQGQVTETINHTPKIYKSQEERIKLYFSMLMDDVKSRLYNLYKIDFEMFGYSTRDLL